MDDLILEIIFKTLGIDKYLERDKKWMEENAKNFMCIELKILPLEVAVNFRLNDEPLEYIAHATGKSKEEIVNMFKPMLDEVTSLSKDLTEMMSADIHKVFGNKYNVLIKNDTDLFKYFKEMSMGEKDKDAN